MKALNTEEKSGYREIPKSEGDHTIFAGVELISQRSAFQTDEPDTDEKSNKVITDSNDNKSSYWCKRIIKSTFVVLMMIGLGCCVVFVKDILLKFWLVWILSVAIFSMSIIPGLMASMVIKVLFKVVSSLDSPWISFYLYRIRKKLKNTFIVIFTEISFIALVDYYLDINFEDFNDNPYIGGMHKVILSVTIVVIGILVSNIVFKYVVTSNFFARYSSEFKRISNFNYGLFTILGIPQTETLLKGQQLRDFLVNFPNLGALNGVKKVFSKEFNIFNISEIKDNLEKLSIQKYYNIDTSMLDKDPFWTYDSEIEEITHMRNDKIAIISKTLTLLIYQNMENHIQELAKSNHGTSFKQVWTNIFKPKKPVRSDINNHKSNSSSSSSGHSIDAGIKRKKLSHLNIEHFKLCFDDALEANEYFNELDNNHDGQLSFKELSTKIYWFFKKILYLKQTLLTKELILLHLNWLFTVGLIFIMLFIILLVFRFTFTEAITLYASILTILVVFFHGYLTSLINSMLFIFAQNVFSIGDIIMLDGQELKVRKLNLFTTVFTDLTNKQLLYSNNDLYEKAKTVINFSRNKGHIYTPYIYVNMNTKFDMIKLWRQKLSEYCKLHCPGVKYQDKSILIRTFIEPERFALKVLFVFETFYSFADQDMRWTNESKINYGLKQIAIDIGIDVLKPIQPITMINNDNIN